MKYLAAVWLVLTVVVGYQMMGMAFLRGQANGHLQGLQQGYEQGQMDGHAQGYEHGQASMVQTQERVLMQCTAWWFNNSGRSAVTAINEYCERTKK